MRLNYKKFILFGDSITELSNDQNGFAFAPAVQSYYTRKLDVITRGYRGYNTDHGVIILPEILKAEKASGDIKLMTIFMGTNDAAQSAIQHVPVNRYRKNLDNMVTLALSHGIKPIVIGPTLHDQKLSLAVLPEEERKTASPVSSSRVTKLYSEAAKSVAEKHGVAFVDLWLAFQSCSDLTEEEILSGADLSKFFVDGVHFSPYGYEIMYKEVIEAIKKFYPELDAGKLPTMLADMLEIDPKDIKNTVFRSK